MFLTVVFSLQIKMYVNASNQEDLLKLSQEKPAFLLFFSHFCGHCKRAYPMWTEFMTHYENDTDLITAESDCVDNPQTCNFFMKVNGYPTFAYLVNKRAAEIYIRRNLTNFIDFAEKLKTYDPNIPCKMNIDLERKNEFPYFMYNSSSSYLDSCNSLSGVKEDYKKLIFIEPLSKSLTSPLLTVFFEKDMSVVFEKVETSDDINEIMKEQMQIPLSNFVPRNHISTNRRIALLLYSEKRHINQFKDLAYKRAKDILFQKMNVTDFKKQFPNVKIEESDVPLILFSDKNKNRFLIRKQQTASELENNGEIAKVINGAYDNNNMVMLFDDGQNNDSNFVNESTSHPILLFFMIFAIVLLILFLISFSISKYCKINRRRRRNYYLDHIIRQASNIVSDSFHRLSHKSSVAGNKDIML
ncbi:hypothetical protein TRFO_17154 [Tritrichomonas foetus]|uniref:Thioredoxin domain-containing protein n=1 Tax=Tritrichomonas foetus TaxID=1144522 RepID=A0A1J4KNS5_9EUKA|nr:hypothetical protein TRFO_17154 [Tritrichomonas foetus]|eukprot:OHT12883.1 hypothetical protein TRFO_17154 [Tritrichomonas foetus]